MPKYPSSFKNLAGIFCLDDYLPTQKPYAQANKAFLKTKFVFALTLFNHITPKNYLAALLIYFLH